MKYFFTSIFILLITTIFASTSVIKGSAKSFAGKEIILYTYSDYITQTQKSLGYTNVLKDGSFNFEFDVNETSKVFIKIEDKTTWFFVEPGAVYNLSLSYQKEANKGRIYDKRLSLKFSFPAPTELNQQIKKFNKKYDIFFDENYELFVKRDRSVIPKIKTFKEVATKDAMQNGSVFLNNYVSYTIASLENKIDIPYNTKNNIKNQKNVKVELFLEYLKDKPILYNNPEYINLFRAFFKDEIKELTLNVSGLDITKAINEKNSLKALNLALSKYPFLENDEFKGLFLLHGLEELSSDKYFNQSNLLNILNNVAKSSKYPKQQIIAKNIVNTITKEVLKEGSTAPLFSLKNVKGEAISISSFKGKHLYINFWANWSIPSQKEMKIMEMMYKKYKGKIEFISICTDNEMSKMQSFLKSNSTYNWTFLHADSKSNVVKDYNVRTLPLYFLIDDNLKIMQAPAARPGGAMERTTEENIEKIFYEITKK